MKLGRSLVTLFLVSGILPLAVAVRATCRVDQCCYGTTCPEVQGCTKTIGNPGPWQCKRTCSPCCSDGNGCCQFRVVDCTYSGGADCSSHNSTSTIDVSWGGTTKCYSAGGGEVSCYSSANAQCAVQ